MVHCSCGTYLRQNVGGEYTVPDRESGKEKPISLVLIVFPESQGDLPPLVWSLAYSTGAPFFCIWRNCPVWGCVWLVCFFVCLFLFNLTSVPSYCKQPYTCLPLVPWMSSAFRLSRSFVLLVLSFPDPKPLSQWKDCIRWLLVVL